MLGDPDSCGIWAPCLTHDDGLFYLVYTDVKRYGRTTVGGASGASLRDFHNYVVTSRQIDGEWSDPVYLNSSGFDPSLFHDDDGRKYLLNMLWDHRPGRNRFAGIVLQEYSAAERRLIGIAPGDLRGHADRLHRGAAPLQARRVLLPAHRRGRHRLGACCHDGAVPVADGPLRAASGRVHPDLRAIAPTPHCSAQVTPIWSTRRAARRSSSICAGGRFPIAAGARWAAKRPCSR